MKALGAILAAALLLAPGIAGAKVTLPSIFSDNMVLQQKTEVAVWGTSDRGRTVTVAPSWTHRKYRTSVSADGKWSLRIPTPEAGGPYSIVFNDGDKTVLGNVLLGEVWYCSGQSNMHMPMKGFKGQPVEGAADYILSARPSVPIRMCTVKRTLSLTPLQSSGGSWQENTPEAVAETSAVAYFFALKLQSILDVPVGLIISNWSGSTIESWMDRETIEKDFAAEFDLSFLDGDSVPGEAPRMPCALYNGQVAPLVPFTFRGIIWYQGENNRERPEQYSRLQPAYVSMMRRNFQNPDAAFYFVQIAPFKFDNPRRYYSGYFHEMQEKTLSLIPNSGMAATVDLGDFDCIHAPRKKPVGDRLAYLALTKTYGLKGISAESPSFKGVVFEAGKATVTMNVSLGGLAPSGQELDSFELAGEDRIFRPAKGVITDTRTVVVTSPDVKAPVAIRYCWRNWTVGTMFNDYGFPALPFRSDDWPEESVPIRF